MEKPRSARKQVSLYNAETQKTKCHNLRVADFASEEELDAYCRKLKDENRLRNKAWKEAQATAKIQKFMGAELVLPRGGYPPNPLGDNGDMQAPVSSGPPEIELDPGTGSTIAIYGSSKRGKTTLMMYLYEKYFMDSSRINTLFSGNPQLKIYKKDSKLLVAYGFNAKSSKYIQLQQYLNVKTKNRYKFTDMFDDIIDQKYSPILNKLVLTYRNSNISSIICLQYVFMLSKQNRSSVNHTFVFGSNTAEDEKNIIDALLRPYLTEIGLKSYADQVAFYRAATTDHGFIYLNNIKNKMSFHRLAM